MSYNHNPFLILSDAIISAGIVDVTSRVKATETKLKDTLYLIANTNTFEFENKYQLFMGRRRVLSAILTCSNEK